MCAMSLTFGLQVSLLDRLVTGRLLLEAKVHQGLGLLPWGAPLRIPCSLFSFLVATAKGVATFIKAQRFQQALEGVS